MTFSINLPKDFNVIMFIIGIINLITAISIALVFKKCRVDLKQ